MAEIELSKPGLGWLRWVVLVLALLGACGLLLLLSALNAERLELAVVDGQVLIQEGDFFLFGESVYDPTVAYAPVELPDDFDVQSLPLGECASLSSCESRFFDSILLLIAYHLVDLNEDDLDEIERLMVRAQLFPSVSLAEREPLEDYMGVVHYLEALILLEEVREDLDTVHKKLERGRIAQVPFADRLLLERLILAVEEQLRMLQSLGIGVEEPEEVAPQQSEVLDMGGEVLQELSEEPTSEPAGQVP